MSRDKKVILSINRFERKKNIGMAIDAFDRLVKAELGPCMLVVAGNIQDKLMIRGI
jgi:alpha-1,3/alpha-1,6-mannosyltransferase